MSSPPILCFWDRRSLPAENPLVSLPSSHPLLIKPLDQRYQDPPARSKLLPDLARGPRTANSQERPHLLNSSLERLHQKHHVITQVNRLTRFDEIPQRLLRLRIRRQFLS